MKEEISIKVNIADSIYPLRVSIEEESNIREAARNINEKVRKYKQEFEIKEKQVLLAMVALEFATEARAHKSRNWIEDQGVTEKVKEIENLLKDI